MMPEMTLQGRVKVTSEREDRGMYGTWQEQQRTWRSVLWAASRVVCEINFVENKW